MNEPDMFSHSDITVGEPVGLHAHSEPASARGTRTQRAALWAAYGDALGWISELTNANGLSRRTRGKPLTELMQWKRRIGGRSGVNVVLPIGCYSDDTQLRLATSRAIRPEGFDVEAFAKVELPVWLSYGLGGGKSTSAAASHLCQTRSTWWRNTFSGWTDSGGNGAAMRIQPHVWATRTPHEPESYLLDVVRNAICTHSHPTGLMGAVLHAQCVAHALVAGQAPSPDDLNGALAVAARLPEMVENDHELAYWRVAFEEHATSFREAWATSLEETKDALAVAVGCGRGTSEGRYSAIVDGLELREPARRGSGMLTAVAAAALAWCEPRVADAIRVAANTLGTDTDTIATMVGAVLGATADSDPSVDVLDAELIRRDAGRLAKIAAGGVPASHQYPDLMHWLAPKTRADALVRIREGGLSVRGLGHATEMDENGELVSHGFRWRWVRLESGQTLLVKGRQNLPFEDVVSGCGPDEARTATIPKDAPTSTTSSRNQRSNRATPAEGRRTHQERSTSAEAHDVRGVVEYVREHIDEDAAIGRALRRVVSKGTTGEVAGFVAALIDLLEKNRVSGRR